MDNNKKETRKLEELGLDRSEVDLWGLKETIDDSEEEIEYEN
jgi:hypothetical protein